MCCRFLFLLSLQLILSPELMKEVLFGKTLEQLGMLVEQHDLPRFAAGQIAAWLYRKNVAALDTMTD
jgi:23S rRNA (adenine2503-C2)-methyltransferase